MHPDLQSLFYKSQEHYLQPVEMRLLKHHISDLEARLQVYEWLRDHEVTLFQPVADQLQQAFAQTPIHVLEKSLRQWLAVMRYASMAMLVCNPEFLQHRLLEWLTEVIQAHNTTEISDKIYQLLQEQLRQQLAPEKLDFILPLLDQARVTVVGAPSIHMVVEA
jgi:Phycobilisome protein